MVVRTRGWFPEMVRCKCGKLYHKPDTWTGELPKNHNEHFWMTTNRGERIG